MLHCTPANVAIVNSATAAWQRVFLGLPLWQPGSRVITSVAEYGSNYLAYLQVCAAQLQGDIDCVPHGKCNWDAVMLVSGSEPVRST